VKILVLNWQDLANPQSGGAEIHLHEIFGRLAARGHEVTLLCSGWAGARARAENSGIQIHRTGGRNTYSLAAPRYFRRHLASTPWDVVVEDLNKIPLFAPYWVRRPLVLLVHHLFGATAFREASAPFAAATWLLERPISRVYRGLPTQAVSESTADDLVERGLRREDIRIIHNGVDLGFFQPAPSVARDAEPMFVSVGRLRRYKRIDHVIQAVARLKASGRYARLRIAGRGPDEARLRETVARLGVGELVSFEGFVSEEQKRDLMRRAWATVQASPKEGWGITNMEAAACGTPTIASDSPGLRESVVHGETGFLYPHGDIDALAAAIDRLASDRARVEALGAGALAFAQRFTWDRAADLTEAHLAEVAGQGRAGRGNARRRTGER
jgi:glycosyltransferase involved in cell wall biosynthesis